MSSPRPRVLVAALDVGLARDICRALASDGCDTDVADSEEALWNGLERWTPQVLACEHDLVCERGRDGLDGLEVLLRIRESHPHVAIVVIGPPEIRAAVAAFHAGARDYVPKPADPREVRDAVVEAFERMWPQLRPAETAPIAHSPAMQRLLAAARILAATDTSVMLTGESGTGKEVVARFIQSESPRRSRPFVVVNCAAIAASLCESELFGHRRGAFTGAMHTHRGSFELADGGTLFLDEICEMPLDMQAKILRALEAREIRRIGAEEAIAVDTRIISATNKDPEQEARAGRLRRDLYWRLNVVQLWLPPLRERVEDIEPLAYYFLRQLRQDLDRPEPDFSPEVLDVFTNYHWPGNVRELRNAVECAAVFARDGASIRLGHLPAHLRRKSARSRGTGVAPLRSLQEVESEHIRSVLDACAGNRTRAAAILGVSPVTLWRKSRSALSEPLHLESANGVRAKPRRDQWLARTRSFRNAAGARSRRPLPGAAR